MSNLQILREWPVNPLPEHLKSNEKLLKDVTLQIGEKNFKANKEILEIFSPVLKALLSDI